MKRLKTGDNPREHEDSENIDMNIAAWSNEDQWSEWKNGDAWSSYPSVPKVNGRILQNSDEMWSVYLWPLIKSYVNEQSVVLELAPGYGRCSRYLVKECAKLYLVDLNKNCANFCNEYFVDDKNVYCFVNDGKSLPMIESNSQDFVFSWDSFVHISKKVTRQYIIEISRVLKKGGTAFIHHSNAGIKNQVAQLGWRSNMTAEAMCIFCKENDLTVVLQSFHYELDNGLYNDCVTIFCRM